MTHFLFLRIRDPEQLTEPDSRVQWLLHDGEGEPPPPSTGTLEDAAAAAAREKECRIIILLPEHSVLIREVVITRSHTKHLRDAAVYAVEEHLAEAADEAHIAVGNTVLADTAEGLAYGVGIIRDSLMRRVMDALADAGLTPNVVTADLLLLPCGREQATIALEGNDVLFRLAPAIASSLEKETFLSFFDDYLIQQKSQSSGSFSPAVIRSLYIWSEAQDNNNKPFFDSLHAVCKKHNVALEKKTLPGALLSWLGHLWFSAAPEPINFLQGSYQPQNQTHRTAARWNPLALVMALWFVIQVALDGGMALYLSFRAGQLHAKSVALYQELFPKDNKIVDLKAQTQQHIKSASTGGGMIPLLGVLTANGTLVRRVQVSLLHYDEPQNELMADVIANDFSVFDQYRQSGGTEFNIEVGSIVQEENGVRGQIRIRGRQ